jgi:hypothetical protein
MEKLILLTCILLKAILLVQLMSTEQFYFAEWIWSGCTNSFPFIINCSSSKQIYQESEILEQIDRDVKRTHPDMPFFSAKSNQVRIQCLVFMVFLLLPVLPIETYCLYWSFELLSGISEAYSDYLFKIEPKHKIRARNEWSFSTSILRIQEWPWPKQLSKFFSH